MDSNQGGPMWSPSIKTTTLGSRETGPETQQFFGTTTGTTDWRNGKESKDHFGPGGKGWTWSKVLIKQWHQTYSAQCSLKYAANLSTCVWKKSVP